MKDNAANALYFAAQFNEEMERHGIRLEPTGNHLSAYRDESCVGHFDTIGEAWRWSEGFRFGYEMGYSVGYGHEEEEDELEAEQESEPESPGVPDSKEDTSDDGGGGKRRVFTGDPSIDI